VITDTRLQSNILLRTGARNQAINYNCSDVALSVPWFFARSDKQSTTTLGCSTLDAESGFSGPVKPYWQPWRNGHDKIIWEKIPNGARPLFEDVFPAKAR